MHGASDLARNRVVFVTRGESERAGEWQIQDEVSVDYRCSRGLRYLTSGDFFVEEAYIGLRCACEETRWSQAPLLSPGGAGRADLLGDGKSRFAERPDL